MSDLLERLRHEHPDVVIWAAGGVVTRSAEHGVEILVVHRPRYDDWSLPKGKIERGESLESTAVREVLEETGFNCTLEVRLPTVTYYDAEGRRKAVVYWVMAVDDGSFQKNDEVNEVRWLRPDEARMILDYERDAELLSGSLSQILDRSSRLK